MTLDLQLCAFSIQMEQKMQYFGLALLIKR